MISNNYGGEFVNAEKWHTVKLHITGDSPLVSLTEQNEAAAGGEQTAARRCPPDMYL